MSLSPPIVMCERSRPTLAPCLASTAEEVAHVPPNAARAIAETMCRTLLMAWNGTGVMLSNLPIWVQPMARALSVEQAGGMPTGCTR